MKKLDINKIIFYVAFAGMIFCIFGFVSSIHQTADRITTIQQYECQVEQYTAVNYYTNVCMLDPGFIHERCFHDAVTSMCDKKE